MQKIAPFLWFDTQAEEAANFYVSVFKNAKITSVTRYGPAGPGPEGQVMMVVFMLEGHEFMALNGGPQYTFSPAMSLLVNCETQAEVDRLWEKLGEGGQEQACGWLQDKYGVSWQIVPIALGQLMQDTDPAKVQRVTEAMLKMRKIDVAILLAAAQG